MHQLALIRTKPNTKEEILDGRRFKNKLTAGFSASLQTYSLEKFIHSLKRHITSCCRHQIELEKGL